MAVASAGLYEHYSLQTDNYAYISSLNVYTQR